MLKTSEIRRHCFYSGTYSKGLLLYEAKKYRKLQIDEGELGEEPVWITAEVKSSGRDWYESSLQVSSDGEEIEDYECDCLSYQQTGGLCKHCVALALAYQAEQRAGRAASPKYVTEPTAVWSVNPKDHRKSSSYAMDTLIRQCAGQLSEEVGVSPQSVSLRPSFRMDYSGKLTVEFTLGSSRMYVVKDILCLLAAVEQQVWVSYGKNLKFVHSLAAFTPEAVEWLRILREIAVVEKNISDLSARSCEPTANSVYRQLQLEAYGTELCLGHYLDTGDMIPGLGRKVVSADPELTLTITAEPEGASVKLDEGQLQMLNSHRNGYLLFHDTIYRCSPAYLDAVRPVLWAFGVKPNNGYYTAVRSLFLAERDYRSFCRHVLPQVSPYVKVSTRGISLSRYLPEPARFQIYLSLQDREDAMGIEARCEVHYGDKTFDLLDNGREHESYRDTGKEWQVRQCLERFLPEGRQGGMFSCLGEEAVLSLVQTGIPQLQELAELMIDERILRIQVRKPPKITVGISLSNGILTLDLQSSLEDPGEIAQILQSYRLKKKYYRLKNGELLSLEGDSLQLLQEVSDGLHLTEGQLKQGVVTVPQYRALYLDEVTKRIAGAAQVKRNAAFRRMIADLHSFRDSEFEVPDSLQATLRSYQIDGFRWLASLGQYGLGGILADDMGLGKTLQMIAYFLLHRGKNLVVCPASLVYNWESELHRFAPGLSVTLVTGCTAQRKSILEEAHQADVVLTSYDLLKRDIGLYEAMQFDCMVIDEAQYIKNAGTQAAKSVKAVSASVRFALTGTPIENRLSDLWSIFDFILPGYLYQYRQFREELEKPIAADEDPRLTARLRSMIAPFILRRKKTDVLKDLPERLEQPMYASMTAPQETLYRAMESRLAMELSGAAETDFQREQIRILAELTRMRQVCCTPSLCYEDYRGGSGKVELCVQLLQSAVEADHRVLVFSQFTTMLEHLMEAYGGACLYLSGKNTKEQRRDMVARFQNGEVPVFFISLKAGGTGLNLTAADTVIHVDPWWNVAAQNQATDRAHRIGQDKVVTVFKLVTRGTIEERILDLQEQKARLSESVLSGDGIEEAALTREALLKLLGTNAE